MSSSSESSRQGRTPGEHTVEPGGARLRALRLAAGLTQLAVELDAELGTGYVQRLESGRVAQPERATLERLLAVIAPSYLARQEVLRAYGYTAAVSPPDEAERRWARGHCAAELAAADLPALLLDCTHRLLAWNRLVPALFGLPPDDPALGGLARGSFLSAWFRPGSPAARLLVEPDAVLPALVRACRYELRAYGDEPWCAAVLADLQAEPRFRRTWAQVAAEPAPVGAARAGVPLRFAVPGAGVLTFRLSSEPVARDGRFRVVYYLPADAAALAWAARTVEEAARDAARR